MSSYVRKSVPMIALGCAVLALVLALGSARPAVSAGPQRKGTADPAIPSYHNGAPEGSLPATVDSTEFDQVVVQNAYRLAAHLKSVLYQQPCYCYCDRHHGHTSLLDCYTHKHTSGCQPCLKELFYVYEQTNKGQNPDHIREGIIRGAWKVVDITKYEKSVPAGSGLATPLNKSHQ
jgi:Protein of unknown function with PCYCGC motif